jgi:uncharacterized protein
VLRRVALVLLALVMAACNGDDDRPEDAELPVTVLAFENADGEWVELTVEVAVTPEERGRGLGGREELAEDRGMLFWHAEPVRIGFWMMETVIPLSVAFIGEDARVMEIRDMDPLDETIHVPDEPYLLAVEANQGWFQRNGIGPGSRVEVAEEWWPAASTD